MKRTLLQLSVATALVALLAGCYEQPKERSASPPQVGAPRLDTENRLAEIPLGDKATGGDKNTMPVKNPLADSPNALEEGRRLYVKMNCAGCHSYTGKGWMGPDLTDGYWRYGGSADQIYKTLYEGRPQGMPAWGRTLPPESLWQLVTYVQSLSKQPGASTPGEAGTGAVPATGTAISVDPLPPGAENAASRAGSERTSQATGGDQGPAADRSAGGAGTSGNSGGSANDGSANGNAR